MSRGYDGPAGGRMCPRRGGIHNPFRRGIARRMSGVFLAAGLLVASGQSGAGHSLAHYPSYYPDEIRVEALDPATAAKGLADQTLHAYIGAAPHFAGQVPGHVKAVKSFGSFLVLAFNPASARFASAAERCTAARGIMAMLRGEETAGFVFHPYPVTPYHADYLHHLDRVEAVTAAIVNEPAPPSPLEIGAKGAIAEAVVKTRWRLAADRADATLLEVSADALIADGIRFDGWLGPPWAKEGWFQAYQLLAAGLDAEARRAADEAYTQLVRGETVGLAERINLERRLVAALTEGCKRTVVGYAPKVEYVNEAYPPGIENIGYDSLSGLNSPIFLRTVKLKEYPWNGKLHLGVGERSTAAWNPVAGFTDVMGGLIWSAVGDPAMIQFPSDASWMPNRVQSTVAKLEGQSGGIGVPADAVRPQPGTGMLQRVGARTFSSAKVVYEVLASPFGDGTEMAVADLLYPFVFAYRWGSRTGAGGTAHEPRLESTLDTIEERLAGLKVVRVERTTHAIAENLNVVQNTPVVEVYLRDVPRDEGEVAALAPPWTTVPWHLLVLMEEAVIRGHAAFSEEEARRRKVAWLDLVRDEALKAKLLALAAQFERERYRPELLIGLVTPDEAQARWRSLRTFAEKNGHFLVTNGPYRLKEWTPDSAVLEVVRELTYPLGFGTFDRFVNPPRTVIEAVAQERDRIAVSVGAEMILKMGRDYKVVKEPLLRTTMRGTAALFVVSRYLLIGPDGSVLNVDKMLWEADGRFTIKLPERLPPGQYTVMLAVFLDGNSMLPSAHMLRVRIGPNGPG